MKSRPANMRVGRATGTCLSYHGNIFIAGLTASGKTTHSYLLAGHFGLTYVSGSQLHLAINGLQHIQERGFWLTEEATRLLTEEQFRIVDQELLRIERNSRGCIFDSWIMPWRRSSEGMSVYLMSSLESRVMKGAVSRRENEFAISRAYEDAIRRKDEVAAQLYKRLHGVDIERDLSVFDIVVDIGAFIEAPTLESSQVSISKTESILEAAVGYYLTGKAEYRERLRRENEGPYLVRNTLL